MAESVLPQGIEEEAGDTGQLSADLAASHALDHALNDPEGQKAAAAFLLSHKRLVDLQIAYLPEEKAQSTRAAKLKRKSDMLRVVTQVAFFTIGLAVASGVIAMWWSALTSRSVVVREFSAPTALVAEGLTGKVAATKILDVLLNIQSATRSAAAAEQITDAWTDSIEVGVPETGVTISQLGDLLHRLFGHDVHLDGTLVQNGDGYDLSIRGDDIPPANFTGKQADLDRMFRKAAEYVFSEAQPLLYATYLIDEGRTDHAIHFIQSNFPKFPDSQRAALANLWGEALLITNDPAGAIDRFRLALQIKPNYWAAWNNLISNLPITENEEEAYRLGVAMDRIGKSWFRFDRPSLYEQADFAQLTMDPAKVIAALLWHRDYGQAEGAEFDDSSWVAEQRAVQHDWPSVALFLAESPADDPTTGFDQLALAGAHALEDGDTYSALTHYVAADALWHKSSELQAFFPDFECDLGHAYAANGRFAQAWPLFQGQRYVRCRAYWADAMDASGNWPVAQRAYRTAEAVAPDLSFAFEREGRAYLRHGDPATAIARERLAHEKSPHWADPLKDWGDALMAEHRPEAALARYHEALHWAPDWDGLHQAMAAAKP
ncbi:UDP-N-acetylglucosamine--peptide N-acetylglucosaminyltransferase SPINDLY family protein [Acidisoma silvae]|uniref:Tetratricopeptide repeat protein n=1 Tax=Acidisoma silvae TaxID=2802396 RepID=A0A964DZP5_9PROT|nr:hypothetical protein [Acidisoma silvae]MCB8876314.1 hypothetical protein [Acidisoma silvae]